MTDTVKEVVTQAVDATKPILQTLLGYLNDTVAFAKEQIPDVAQQILAYNFVTSVALAIVFLFLAGVFSKISYYNFKQYQQYSHSESNPIMMIVAAIVTLVMLGFAIGNSFDAVKIKVAPKYYLIEKVSDMLSPRNQCGK